MKYIFKSRGLGKTADIVKLTKAEQGILIVATQSSKDYIINCLCHNIGIDPTEVKIMTYLEFYKQRKNNSESLKDIPVYIDEFQAVFEEAIGHDITGISGTLTE